MTTILTDQCIGKDDASKKIWDVIVIGSGSAGLATALEACRNNKKTVLVITAGEEINSDHLSVRQSEKSDDSISKLWSTKNQNYSPAPGTRPVLGGRSLCWHGVVLRIDDHALKKWPDSLKNELIKKEGLYDVIELTTFPFSQF